jgi:hypothetical protein
MEAKKMIDQPHRSPSRYSAAEPSHLTSWSQSGRTMVDLVINMRPR